MKSREIRMGIDVGGTHTKAVALDNETHEIVGVSLVMTTHDDLMGVSTGVVEAFEKCLSENNINSEDVIFVAHSTTQATNALLEGDVAGVGILGMGKRGLEGWLAKRQSKIEDIDLGTGRSIKINHTYLTSKDINEESIANSIDSLRGQGVEVIVASKAFGVDDLSEERLVSSVASKRNIPVTVASDISKLYGLTRRTRTASINASILPKMLDTADSTEYSVRKAGIEVPLMIMRGDGGVMSIDEMKRRPVLTMLSGPAASVVGALMYLRASNGIYFEVGGTSTNIGVIKNGRPTVDYTIIGGHSTYISSLDVRVLGIAGGSMVRISGKEILDVGPRSAHIAGMEYAVYTNEEEIINPQVELFSPKEGDPQDYVSIKLENGKRITITNSCAANVLGYAQPEHFTYGNQKSARKAMEPLAKMLDMTVEQVALKILEKDYQKIKPVLDGFIEKYKLEKDQITLVGVGGGAGALIPFVAEKMNIPFNIPHNAEIISSIGVALAMVRDVVERVIPNPTEQDIISIKREAAELAISNGALPESIEVQIQIDSQTSRVTAIALGSTQVQTTDLLKVVDEKQAMELASKSMGVEMVEVNLVASNDHFYVFSNHKADGNKQYRLIDKKGFIRIQRGNGHAISSTVAEARQNIEYLWESLMVYKSDVRISPDIYLCIGAKVLEYEGILSLEQLLVVTGTELNLLEPEDQVIIIGGKNDL